MVLRRRWVTAGFPAPGWTRSPYRRRPAPGAELTREAGGLWLSDAPGQEIPPHELDVRQGHLEGSNVDPITAMVDMIEIQRAYAAVQKAMTTSHAATRTFTTQIGRLG